MTLDKEAREILNTILDSPEMFRQFEHGYTVGFDPQSEATLTGYVVPRVYGGANVQYKIPFDDKGERSLADGDDADFMLGAAMAAYKMLKEGAELVQRIHIQAGEATEADLGTLRPQPTTIPDMQ